MLDPESVRNVIDAESPDAGDLLPAVVAYGGQTPLNLAAPLAAGGVPLLGSDLETIDQAEERTRFSALRPSLPNERRVSSRTAGWRTRWRRP